MGADAPLHGITRDNGSDRAAWVMTIFATLAVFLIPLYIGLFSERIYRRQLAPMKRIPQDARTRTRHPDEQGRPRRAA